MDVSLGRGCILHAGCAAGRLLFIKRAVGRTPSSTSAWVVRLLGASRAGRQIVAYNGPAHQPGFGGRSGAVTEK